MADGGQAGRWLGGQATRSTSKPATGTVALPELPEGSYTVTIRKPGFETVEKQIEVEPGVSPLIIELKLSAQQTTVEVDFKRSTLANSDPNYRSLRSLGPQSVFRVDNLVLQRDIGTFTFRTGQFVFFAPVLGKTVMAAFTGDGSFHLKPLFPIDANYLNSISGAPEIEEPFRSVVLTFTDETAAEIKKTAVTANEPAQLTAYREFRERVRYRGAPRSLVDVVLGGEYIANVDADLLAELYAPSRHSFSAYIHGTKHPDLRFLVHDSGAIPHLPSPEEVAVINRDPEGEHDGIWFMSHLRSEWEKLNASNGEDHRWVQAKHYQLETTISPNDRLIGQCTVDFTVLVEGARVIKFGLLPALRVRDVKIGARGISFIQESGREDGSFYAVLPEAAKAGENVQLTIDYEGDKVVRNSGGGTFAVGARTSWYPSLNAFTDRATYDLTFRIPQKYSLVSVGKLDKTWKERDREVSHWVSEIPLAVAGFNYGDFKKIEKTDDQTGYSIEVYSTGQVPDSLGLAALRMQLTPSAMAKTTQVDATNAIRVFQNAFGKIPYGRIAITEQPQMFFGQSWPSLVYLPITAFLDPTQRLELFGRNAFSLGDFVDEVIPHEVSHQWWGHAVGWSTYHDSWLSEGLADFSAGYYLQAAGQQQEFLKNMERQRKRILDRNKFGLRANDAGPISLGPRLDTFRTPRAYNDLVYAKGGFVAQMLRSLMWDNKTQDQDFMEMMKDFVVSGFNKNATTENFRAVVTKHMKPEMDLAGTKTMNWFFDEWIYGTDLPKYRLDYSVRPAKDGKFELSGALTQSDVSKSFRMKVPLYAEIDRQTVRLGLLFVMGNSTGQEFKVLLPKKPSRVAVNMMQDVLAAETINQER